MCAIAGILDLPFDSQILDKMLSTMLHRGPDGTGTYMEKQCCLLHSRLAIIDPEGGAQPMSLYWGSEEYVITYNGELYNTSELKAVSLRWATNLLPTVTRKLYFTHMRSGKTPV